MRDNTTIEGLLVKRKRHEYILIKTKVLVDAGTSHDLGGHVEVPREGVYVLQHIERGSE